MIFHDIQMIFRFNGLETGLATLLQILKVDACIDILLLEELRPDCRQVLHGRRHQHTQVRSSNRS